MAGTKNHHDGGSYYMARLQGESSNSLFDELADWNEQLSHCDYYKDTDEPLDERRLKKPSNSPKGGLL